MRFTAFSHRRHTLPATMLLLAGIWPSQTVRAQDGTEPATVSVVVDNAKLMRLPEKTQTVIVGNPMIADVALQRNGVLILTGKSFGSTNLIALDVNGAMLAESMIRVEAKQAAVITVQRGLERESYSCTPNCQPSVQLGDSTKYFGEVSSQATTRNGLATTSTGPAR